MSRAAPKLLLVDDDEQLLQLLAMRLRSGGYEVATANSGDAALASLAVSRPEVVVTDLRMPGMDGLALDARDVVPTPLDEARRAFEREYLVRILKIAGGSVTRAARLAGRNRTEFYRLLQRHALDLTEFKPRRARGNRAEAGARDSAA